VAATRIGVMSSPDIAEEREHFGGSARAVSGAVGGAIGAHQARGHRRHLCAAGLRAAVRLNKRLGTRHTDCAKKEDKIFTILSAIHRRGANSPLFYKLLV